MAGDGELGAVQHPRIGDGLFGDFQQGGNIRRIGEVGPGRRELGEGQAIVIRQLAPGRGGAALVAPVHRPIFDEGEAQLFGQRETLFERHLLEPGIQVDGIARQAFGDIARLGAGRDRGEACRRRAQHKPAAGPAHGFLPEAGDAGGRAFVQRAVGARDNAFAGLGIGHEVLQLPGLGAADIDALLAFAVVVAGIERVVLVDIEAAGMVEGAVFRQPLAILVEDLDAAIDPVGDEQAALGIERQRMGIAELALAGAEAAPGLDELAVRA